MAEGRGKFNQLEREPMGLFLYEIYMHILKIFRRLWGLVSLKKTLLREVQITYMIQGLADGFYHSNSEVCRFVGQWVEE